MNLKMKILLLLFFPLAIISFFDLALCISIMKEISVGEGYDIASDGIKMILILRFMFLSTFLFMILYIIKDIITPLEELTAKINRISTGNFKVYLGTIKRTDEIGALTNAISKILTSTKLALLKASTKRNGSKLFNNGNNGDDKHE